MASEPQPPSWQGVWKDKSVTTCAVDQGGSGIDRGACLEMEPADRRPVVQCVKGGDLVDTHWGHLQDPSDFIHNANTREAMLPLSQVKKRHYGRFLVLRGIAFEDLIDELLADGVELERDLRVVIRSISMLHGPSSAQDSRKRRLESHTT